MIIFLLMLIALVALNCITTAITIIHRMNKNGRTEWQRKVWNQKQTDTNAGISSVVHVQMKNLLVNSLLISWRTWCGECTYGFVEQDIRVVLYVHFAFVVSHNHILLIFFFHFLLLIRSAFFSSIAPLLSLSLSFFLILSLNSLSRPLSLHPHHPCYSASDNNNMPP